MDAFFCDPGRILGDQQGFPVRNDSVRGVYQGIGSEYEITCALIVVVFLLYDLFFICLSTEIGKYLAVLLLVVPFCTVCFRTGSGWHGDILHALLCALGLIASSAEEHDRQRNGSAFLSGDSIAAVALDRIFSRKIPSGAAF